LRLFKTEYTGNFETGARAAKSADR